LPGGSRGLGDVYKRQLMGYEARPSALQLVFYMATIILIATATRWVSKSTTRSHDLPNSSGQTLPV
jgi:hypothetical protein